MKISKVGSGKKAATASRPKAAAGNGDIFADHLREAAASLATSGVTESAAAQPLGSILAVQETPDSTQARSRGLAMQYGGDLLEHLEDLRRDLLGGAIAKEKLSGLAQKMRAQRRQTDDPRLNTIIDEIELRAEVEIAKLTFTG